MRSKYLTLSVLFLLIGLLYSCGLSNKQLFSKLEAADTGITFSNRITENDTMNIIDFEYVYNGGGTALADFNNDGLQDVFFTGNQVPSRLYINKGDFKFEDITEKAGIQTMGKWCSGVSLVDINNDGWMDIYVSATHSKVAEKRRNLLFVNQALGKGSPPTFREMADEYGIADESHTTNAAFFDYDNDGDLDLYLVVNTIEQYPNAYRPKVNDGTSLNTDRLYQNTFDPKLGHAYFKDVSRQAGILHDGYGLGINITDINRDGWKDIYVTNDYLTDDHLYINNQNGTFTDRSADFLKHTSNSAMGNDIADINNDGLSDIVALDMLPRDNYRKKMLVGPNNYQTYLNNEQYQYSYQYVRNTLQLNQGFRPGTREPVFSEISLMANVAETDWSWTPSLADFDHDGYRDLLVTNGFPKDVTDRDFIQFRSESSSVASKSFLLEQIPVVKISNYAFRNTGNLQFEDVTKEWGLNIPSFSNGAAYGDLDNDGDLDYVVNNINDSAFVFRNNLVERKPDNANYLRLKFVGGPQNREGLGAIVEIEYGKDAEGKPIRQIYEHSPYRGYLSTVEPFGHFGLGNDQVVNQLRVFWPNGKAQTLRNVKANQLLTLDISRATEYILIPPLSKPGLFRELTDSIGVHFVHQEPEYIDFNLQKLLPHKLSQYGPALAVGDLNGDGIDDMVVGGSTHNATRLLIQDRTGRFTEQLIGSDGPQKVQEDMGLLLFDVETDGDLDLYVASGGYEGNPNTPVFQDRLYINDGGGHFAEASNTLPVNYTSKSCVKAADFDHDGDLDLFVGGRVVPNQYPRPVSSLLLRNDSRPGQPRFTDVTAKLAPSLINVGLVCDALWTDINNDGWMDLMLAGEWMPITLLENQRGKFETSAAATQSLSPYVGWWNSLAAADFDRDGDMDYVAGNFGRNSLNRASDETPVRMYAKDFDNNGFYDAIPTVYFPDHNGEQKEVSFFGREDLAKQMIILRGRFPYYKDLALATAENLLKPEELKDALTLKANYLQSAYLENKGNGEFAVRELPVDAQVAPLFGMLADDFDKDGNPDVLLTGNDYGNELFVGRMDALNGLLLRGDGKGGFQPLLPQNSGFYVPGNAKGLARLMAANGTPLVVTTQNRGPLKVFACQNTGQLLRFQSADAAALITLRNRRKQRIEVPYGHSFFSQSSREIFIPADAQSVEIITFKGARRSGLQPKALARIK